MYVAVRIWESDGTLQANVYGPFGSEQDAFTFMGTPYSDEWSVKEIIPPQQRAE